VLRCIAVAGVARRTLTGHAVSAKRPDPEDRRIGKLLRALRLMRRMTQGELGACAGVSFQQIQKYEQGINRIGAGRLKVLSAALGVPATHFFAEPPDRNSAKAGPPPDELLFERKNLRMLAAFEHIAEERVRDALLDLVENAARRFPKAAQGKDGAQ
jgi:transcriptional regulator with XRE-family HTH domain